MQIEQKNLYTGIVAEKVVCRSVFLTIN